MSKEKFDKSDRTVSCTAIFYYKDGSKRVLNSPSILEKNMIIYLRGLVNDFGATHFKLK